ncbi:MAG: helix-turn-helix domain-containing protein [Clostridia bacterium]|nr:helix-turn-helix domain-containing protein [Clostridia bacterium]
MTSKCKLFYQIDPPLAADFPVRAVIKEAIGQQREIIEQVQDYGQVTYHSDGAIPFIKNVKGRTISGNLLPDRIPEQWETHMPDTLGFHMHENLELTLVTEGRMLYIVDGCCIEAAPGDVIFFGSYIPHAWVPDRSAPVNVIEITFKADFIERYKISGSPLLSQLTAGNLKYLRIPAGVGATAQRIRSIAAELASRSFGYQFAVSLELNLTLLTMLRRMGSLPEKSEQGQSQVIRAVRDYIAAHLAENPGLSEIAAAVYVTPHHLSYLFKKQVGIGISDYMNQQKILRTAELLSDSELSILDIALRSGFTSKSNFYRVFKEYYGITPQQMRDALTDQKLSERRPDNMITEESL